MNIIRYNKKPSEVNCFPNFAPRAEISWLALKRTDNNINGICNSQCIVHITKACTAFKGTQSSYAQVNRISLVLFPKAISQTIHDTNFRIRILLNFNVVLKTKMMESYWFLIKKWMSSDSNGLLWWSMGSYKQESDSNFYDIMPEVTDELVRSLSLLIIWRSAHQSQRWTTTGQNFFMADDPRWWTELFSTNKFPR